MKDDINRKDGPGIRRIVYIMGFILSLILTLVAYFIVSEKLIEGWALVAIVGALAFVQVVAQLVFFLHLGQEPAPPWNLFVFLFMVLIVLIILGGSIWIMHHLDYQMAKMPATHEELPK